LNDEENTMLYEILAHTPIWVWTLFVAILWLGLVQTAPRSVRLRRVILLPLAMTGLSLYGCISSFGTVHSSWFMWVGAALATGAWVGSDELPAGIRYDAPARLFNLPGSWVPLGLMMAIFMTKYATGVMLAMHPALAYDSSVAAIVASLYGAMSGVFIGRMARLLRLAQASAAEPPSTPPVAWG
jgi:hypothetical protein